MAPTSYVSTYQGDFGGRSRTSGIKATRPGPSLIARQGGGGGAYSKPSSWSSSPMGQPSTSQGYNKFSPAEWSNSNTYHYNSADQSRHQSERIRGEALRLIADRDRRTVASQRLVDQQLGDRLRDTTSWRSELSAELDRNKNETNLLFKTRNQLEHAINETEKPLRVNSECIYKREGRMGIDRVKDAVEHNLHSEVDNIRNVQNQMKDTLNTVNQQISGNRHARHQLELDLNNKDGALNIDHSARNLHNNSRSINLHGGIEKVDTNISIPESWAHFSHNNIQGSQGARSRSQLLRAKVEDMTNTNASSMHQRWNDTNQSFQHRVAETESAHTRLKSHLSRTMQEIYDQEKHINHLQGAIMSMGPPLKVAQTRLSMRGGRPEIEACRDQPHHRLVSEVGEIQDSVGLLNGKLREAQTSHQDLLRNKSRLEHDLTIKSNSLAIDKQRCLNQRRSFPYKLKK